MIAEGKVRRGRENEGGEKKRWFFENKKKGETSMKTTSARGGTERHAIEGKKNDCRAERTRFG